MIASRPWARSWFSNCPPQATSSAVRSYGTFAARAERASFRNEARSRSRRFSFTVRWRRFDSRVIVLSLVRRSIRAICESGTRAPVADVRRSDPIASGLFRHGSAYRAAMS